MTVEVGPVVHGCLNAELFFVSLLAFDFLLC